MAWRLVLEARCRPTPANGHAVYTPSFTGMGDRAHLLSPDITIDTFVEDLARVILTEELTEVVLVGHSVGGVPISGVADRLPECMAHLVYLDSVVVESGKSAFSYYPQAEVEVRINAAEKATNGRAVPIPQPLPSVWGLGKQGDYDWVRRHLSPHPLRTYTTPLTLRAPVGNGLPRTYVHLTQPSYPALDGPRQLVRSWPGWDWVELSTPHNSMTTHPDDVVGLQLAL